MDLDDLEVIRIYSKWRMLALPSKGSICGFFEGEMGIALTWDSISTYLRRRENL